MTSSCCSKAPASARGAELTSWRNMVTQNLKTDTMPALVRLVLGLADLRHSLRDASPQQQVKMPSQRVSLGSGRRSAPP